MDRAALRADAFARLQQLHLPHTWCFDDLPLAISRHRGRPLHICETDAIEADEHGIWVMDDGIDLLLTGSLAPVHVAHDIAHVILDHCPATNAGFEAEYSADQEFEADTLAEVLLANA